MPDDNDIQQPKRSWAPDPLRVPAPSTVEDTGLPFLFLVELLAKIMFARGQVRLSELVAYSKLPLSVLDPVIGFMRTEHLIEVTRRGTSGTDADLTYNLTDTGRARANDFCRRDSYAGPAPVTFAAYSERVRQNSVSHVHVQRERMAKVFDGIVIDQHLLDQLGAAMNSGRAIFIHGPGGSGKTFIAERLNGLLDGQVAVPYALLIDNAVVPLYDPVIHSTVQESTPPGMLFDRRSPRDARWIRTNRPTVITGGELTLDMLDLRFDPATRLYQAPPHLKANGGIFVIDDLGRQRCSPIDLLNRWIVPMDRQVDYLTLDSGYKFPVPFDVVVVFSSNQPPEALADGAFLRRLGYKIHVGALTPPQFDQVCRQVCERMGLTYQSEAVAWMVARHAKEGRGLMACHPRDLLQQVRDKAQYEGQAPELNTAALEWAWHNYFTGDDRQGERQ